MNIKEISENFSKQRKDFVFFASEVITELRKELKYIMTELPRPAGGFEWKMAKDKGRKVIMQLYYDGQVYLYLRENTSDDDIPPTFMLSLEHEGDFEKIVEKIKNFLQ
jgi:hypothetical protein